MGFWTRACALSVRAVISLPLSFTRSVCRSLYHSLSPGKPEQEERSRRGEEADSVFFFYRYSGGGGGYSEKKSTHPPAVRSGRGRKKAHGCASESAADTALRTLLMPRLWVSDRLHRPAWALGGEGTGGGCFHFNFPPWSPVCGGAFPRSASSVIPSFPLSFPSLLSHLLDSSLRTVFEEQRNEASSRVPSVFFCFRMSKTENTSSL